MNKASREIIDKALSTVKWSIASGLLPRVITPISSIALVWFLAPSDYGVFSIALAILALYQIICDFGIGHSLIQTKNNDETTRNAAFYIIVVASLAFSIGLFLLSDPISKYLNISELGLVLKVISLQTLLMGLGSTPMAILKKDFRFKRLAAIQVLPALCPLLVAIPLALIHFGYWAIIFSSLLATTLQTTLLWANANWLPSRNINKKAFKEILSFSAYVSSEGLIAWVYNRCDKLILAPLVPLPELGLYSLCSNLVVTVTQFVSIGFNSDSIYTMYCSLANKGEQLGALFLKNIQAYSFFLFPVCFGISVVSDNLFPAIFPERWEGLSDIMSILIISPGIFGLTMTYSNVLKATGKPSLLPKLFALYLFIFLPTFLISARYGLTSLIWGKAVLQFLFFIPTTYVTSKALGLKLSQTVLALRTPLISSLIMFGLITQIERTLFPSSLYLNVASTIIFGVLIYLSSVWILDRSIIRGLFPIVRKVIFKIKHPRGKPSTSSPDASRQRGIHQNNLG